MLVFLFKLLVGNRKLCEAPYNKTIDWAKWYVFWADERVVAKNHADSNYKLAKDGLLLKVCLHLLKLMTNVEISLANLKMANFSRKC